MSKKQFDAVINGKFFGSLTTGSERYARQLVYGLDEIVNNQSICLAVPPGANVSLNNISVRQIGRNVGPMWEQIDLSRYVNQYGGSCISLTNTVPLFTHSSIAAILDVRPFLSNNVSGSVSNRIKNAYNKLCMYYAAKRISTIITISNCAKNEIVSTLSVPPESVHVLYPSWEHMDNIVTDSHILDRLGLSSGEYIFSLGSVMPHKNIRWIINAAQNNPDELFVVAGRIDSEIELKPGNVILLGYVTDEEAKALMRSCKMFLSPSLYEGFGMPPLEALAAGCNCLLLADIPVYREVYGEIANYINPLDYNYQVEETYKTINSNERDEMLTKYSSSTASKRFYELLQREIKF